MLPGSREVAYEVASALQVRVDNIGELREGRLSRESRHVAPRCRIDRIEPCHDTPENENIEEGIGLISERGLEIDGADRDITEALTENGGNGPGSKEEEVLDFSHGQHSNGSSSLEACYSRRVELVAIPNEDDAPPH